MKKIIALGLTTLLITSMAVGCTSESSEPSKAEETLAPTPAPIVDNDVIITHLDTDFVVTNYCGIRGQFLLEEIRIREAIDCGFNYLPFEYSGKSYAVKGFEYLEKYGGKCLAVYSSALFNLIHNPDYTLTQADVDAVVEAEVAKYAEYKDKYRGWWLYDEVSASQFKMIGMVQDALHRYDPGKKSFLNLLPDYAPSSMLGTDTYDEYVRRFCEEANPDYLMTDYYAFYYGGGMRNTLYTNLEVLRKYAKQYSLDQELILLCTQHGGTGGYRYLNQAELAYQANVALAYGMKGVSWFIYMNQEDNYNTGWKGVCVTEYGEITERYYEIRKINSWLLTIGNQLYDKTSTAVFHCTNNPQENCEVYESYGKLGNVVTTREAVIGFFDDDSFMIVNGDIEKSNTISMTELNETSGLEYFDSKTSTWKPASENASIKLFTTGKYMLTLEAGEGLLLRVTE